MIFKVLPTWAIYDSMITALLFIITLGCAVQDKEKHSFSAQIQSSVLTAEGMKELLNSLVFSYRISLFAVWFSAVSLIYIE